MPCNSDYLEANGVEIKMSRVLQLLDEFNTGQPVDPMSAGWSGYDRRVYSRDLGSKEERDAMVSELCQRFIACPDISKLSLEAQVWWRDHQRADAERLAKEKQGI